MFSWLIRKIKGNNQSFMGQKEKVIFPKNYQYENRRSNSNKPVKVNSNLKKNLDNIKKSFGNNDEIIYRSFQAGKTVKRAAFLIANASMVEKTAIHENVMRPMMSMELSYNEGDLIRYLKESIIAVIEIGIEDDIHIIVSLVLKGNVALFIEGEKKALVVDVRAYEMRGIEQPVSETVVRGPRDSFVEDMQTNLTLLKRRISQPNLQFEAMTIGTQTLTKVMITYIKGIVNDEIVKEVKRRLENIRIDAILESGYIEEFIEDAPFSLFPTISNTEKPDIVASRLLEGRVAIFVDGTPMVLTVPNLLISHFQVSEDYYSRPFYTNLSRILRILSFFISTMLPGLYITIIYYQVMLIPFSLLVTLTKTRSEVPFQTYIEVIMMVLLFEILRESGIRMPRPIGQAVSIVGALILGTAAVEAGLVSIPVVVIVAISGMSGFIINSLAEAIILLRLGFIIAATIFGLYGILLFGMVVVIHLASIRSFGIPYASPLFPIVTSD